MIQTNDFGQALRIASAAGQDAGNATMRANNRKKWNEFDLQTACETSDMVLTALGFGEWVKATAYRRAEREQAA